MERQRRVRRAESLVRVGKFSSARQALEGAELEPSTKATLDKLQDARHRPHREVLPPRIMEFQRAALHSTWTRKCSVGTSVLHAKESRVAVRHDVSTSSSTSQRGEGHATSLAVGRELGEIQVPQWSSTWLRCGRTEPDGGVRGTVSGHILRRLVARTVAQQLGFAVKAATTPHQHALSSRAVCEYIAHALQGLCELKARMTITSIDGVGTCDFISRTSLPFVPMFDGSPSECFWEDDFGETHR